MERKPRLQGKVAIVTGASRGLGMYAALAFAGEGAHVALLGRNSRETNLHLPGNIYLTAEAIGEMTDGQALPVVCDVADPEQVQTAVDKVLRRWGRIDILLNNAAYVMPEGESPATIPTRLFEQMFQVNVFGAFHLIQAVLPTMRAQRYGNIINVSGRSRTKGSPLESTKAAVETLTIGLANELRSVGVAVNSLRPVGFIDTPGVLLNKEVKPPDLTPPESYLYASVLLAQQTAETYTGKVKTDAEVIRDLTDEETVRRYAEYNPPAWGQSLSAAAAG
ncbi:MAG: SDR family NAD(P)-dependent oxidoreductase [Hyphomonadaceae bacterium]